MIAWGCRQDLDGVRIVLVVELLLVSAVKALDCESECEFDDDF